ncbi:TPA: TrbC/VirB2 family protein [Legionella pneumophila]|nr:TrbC/VirB2 family protein [Legionella pneumophila]
MIKKMKSQYEKLMVMLLLSPSACFASGSNKLVSVIDSVCNFLTGPLIRGAGVTAIVLVGYNFLFTNKIEKHVAIPVIVGLGIVLGAPTLYNMMAG